MSGAKPSWGRCSGENDGFGYGNFPGDGDVFLSFRYVINISDSLHCKCWLPGGCSLKVGSVNRGDHFGKSDEGSSERRKIRYKTERRPWEDSDGRYKGDDMDVLFAELL